MSSEEWEVSQAVTKLSTSAQWKLRTTRSQTRTISGDGCASAVTETLRSVFAGFGIVELFKGFGIVC